MAVNERKAPHSYSIATSARSSIDVGTSTVAAEAQCGPQIPHSAARGCAVRYPVKHQSALAPWAFEFACHRLIFGAQALCRCVVL
jgi:hypothetical protein